MTGGNPDARRGGPDQAERIMQDPRRNHGLVEHVRIAWAMATRDLRARHSASHLGAFWLLASPAALAAVYWFVFGRLLDVRWPGASGGGSPGFVVPFLAGLSVYLLALEVVVSSVGLFAAKRNFVKKSPIPLIALWFSNLFRAAIQCAPMLLLSLAAAAATARLSLEGAAIGVAALAAIAIWLAGVSLVLATLGPFLPDLREIMQLAMRLLFYLAPVTYPLSLVPEDLRGCALLNPLTVMAESWRGAIVFSELPPVGPALAFCASAALIWGVGLWFHRRLSGAIVDVV
jgi:lipopolysaccharide transport system permease protein